MIIIVRGMIMSPGRVTIAARKMIITGCGLTDTCQNLDLGRGFRRSTDYGQVPGA
jgi:hypothetical protein